MLAQFMLAQSIFDGNTAFLGGTIAIVLVVFSFIINAEERDEALAAMDQVVAALALATSGQLLR